MWYKQEGELIPFTSLPWILAFNKMKKSYFEKNFKVIHCSFNKDFAEAFWDRDAMNELAHEVYVKFAKKKDVDKLFTIYKKYANVLEKLYWDTFDKDFSTLSDGELNSFSLDLCRKYADFWSMSLFIDSFDPGYDQEQIARIAQENKIEENDVVALLTPEQLSFANERLLDFLRRLKKYIEKGMTSENLADDNLMKEHVKLFDYYQCSYVYIKNITKEQLEDEARTYLNDKKKLETDHQKLQIHSHDTKDKVKSILKRYGLRENPVYFFKVLTYWREHRKKTNLMGVYVLHRILKAIEQKEGIEKIYLDYMMLDEVEAVLYGKLKRNALKKRYEDTIMVIVDEHGHRFLQGKEAIKLKKVHDDEILRESFKKGLQGQIASKGKAKGKVKVILFRSDFAKFKEGDVLVTGMTRPEHLPLMKKAAAIVTNEGGITCHAAIVARELKKPCIIGTQTATKVLKDGDMVEVDATNGIIKILK